MKIEGYIPAQQVSAKVKSVDEFKAIFPQARIEYIGGKYVVGLCEDCGGPIFEKETYRCDDNGIIWHVKCDVN